METVEKFYLTHEGNILNTEKRCYQSLYGNFISHVNNILDWVKRNMAIYYNSLFNDFNHTYINKKMDIIGDFANNIVNLLFDENII